MRPGSLGGLLQVELTSADLPGCFQALALAGVDVFQLEQTGDLSCTFWIRRIDQKKLDALTAKRGEDLRLRRKRGLYFAGAAFLRRPLLVAGLVIFLLLGAYLPSRVLFVQVEGNQQIPARQILDCAADCGVGFGASRRQVRSEKVKNALLEAVPQLQWAGVNTYGCVAVISVRERNLPPREEPLTTSIVASRDGFILSADVTRGTPLVFPGQTVRQGQTLVSGYSDCGLCIRATGAEGEIYAQTRWNLEAVTPENFRLCTPTGERKRKISLLFQKKRINLWKDSGICDATCGRMYEEYHITLPGGFRLPIRLCVETYTCRELRDSLLSQEQAQSALERFSQRYLKEQMLSGQIQESQTALSQDGGIFRLTGSYDCTEMIGRAHQIGDNHGKRD